VLAALLARKRKIDLILLKAGIHAERFAELLEEAASQSISLKQASPQESRKSRTVKVTVAWLHFAAKNHFYK